MIKLNRYLTIYKPLNKKKIKIKVINFFRTKLMFVRIPTVIHIQICIAGRALSVMLMYVHQVTENYVKGVFFCP